MMFRLAIAAAFLTVFLAGCGGGSEAPAETPRAPQSGTGTGEQQPTATPAYLPSPNIGLVFVQNGAQVQVTKEGGVQTLHLKPGQLKILIPRTTSFYHLYVSKVVDTVYEEGQEISVGGNIFARYPTMPAGGWTLYSTNYSSRFDFNSFDPGDLVVEGNYQVLVTEGYVTLVNSGNGLLVYLRGENSPYIEVPARNHVEFFKVSFD